MRDCVSPEKVLLLSTQIAIELAKGKTIEEINLYKSMASQISSALQVIISQRFVNKSKNCKKDC